MLLLEDKAHSQKELRFHALGKTDNKRKLHITFTIRETRIRVISARPMHKKERYDHDRMQKISYKKNSEFKTEAEERLFGEENDSSDYLDWSQAEQAIFPHLKPTTKAISLYNVDRDT